MFTTNIYSSKQHHFPPTANMETTLLNTWIRISIVPLITFLTHTGSDNAQVTKCQSAWGVTNLLYATFPILL